MDNKKSTGTFIATLQGSAAFQVMNIIVLIVSLISPFNNDYIPPAAFYVILLLIGYFSYRAYVDTRNNYKARQMPQADGKFVPFPVDETWEPWRREPVEEEIELLIRENPAKHVLLVSPSGTGKSTMVNLLIPARFADHQIIRFDHYDNICEQVLFKIGETLESHDDRRHVHDILRQFENGSIDAEQLGLKVDNLFTEKFQGKNVLLVFDQVERYFLRYDSSSSDHSRIASENKAVRVILNKLAEMKNFRTVFAIRSEYMFGSLSSMFNTKSNGVDIDNYVEFYMLWGVNYVDDKDVFYRIKDHLRKLFGGNGAVERLFSISKVETQEKANTFLLNMGGFLYEKLGERPDVNKRLGAPTLTGDDLIDIYLDAAFEGLVASNGPTSRALFDVVLFAIANENRVAGQACDLERLAGLCHYPLADVGAVVKHMSSIGMLNREREDGNEVYRLKHEKLADRALKSDKLIINSTAVDAIRFLTENRAHTRTLTIPFDFPKTFDSPLVSVGYFSVVIFCVYGFLRLLFPEQIYAFGRPFFEWVNGFAASITFTSSNDKSYYSQPLYYAPLFLAHVFWVSYIDRVNRAFIQNVAHGTHALIGHLLSPLGVVLGVTLSFAPEFFVLPIVAVGLVFGLLMISLSHRSNFGGASKSDVKLWGVRTIINVLIVLVFSYVIAYWGLLDVGPSSKSLPGFDSETTVLTMLWLQAAAMIWFWWHIYPEQNTPEVWSAELGLYDKGRMNGA